MAKSSSSKHTQPTSTKRLARHEINLQVNIDLATSTKIKIEITSKMEIIWITIPKMKSFNSKPSQNRINHLRWLSQKKNHAQTDKTQERQTRMRLSQAISCAQSMSYLSLWQLNHELGPDLWMNLNWWCAVMTNTILPLISVHSGQTMGTKCWQIW